MLGLLAVAMAALPAQVLAQSTNTPAPKRSGHPFHGKLVAVDTTAKTIKIGETTYQITSATRITKDRKPATLEDATVGEEMSGYAHDEDGKMVATRVNIGPRPEKKMAPSTPPASDKQ